jgi:hypothetical protein
LQSHADGHKTTIVDRKLPKSPQEKKALNLAKDRGAYFYNNQKAARKAVPLRKAIESRRIRHKNNQAIAQVANFDEATAEIVESSARQNVARKGGWKKSPSEPLGVVIARTLEIREERVGRKDRSRAEKENVA